MINLNRVKKYLRFLPSLVALTVPFLASAQNAVQSGLSTANIAQYFGFGGGGLSSSATLTDLIANGVKLFLTFSGAVAVVFVIIGGFYYLTAQGNEEQAEKGKTTLVNAIIGVVIIIMAYVIINVITNLVSTPSGNGY